MTQGVLGTGLTFEQFIVSLLVLIAGTIAVKITFSFDVNKYMKEKQERYSAKCKNACVHFEFVPKDNTIEAHSFFVSPPGTFNYICQRCGLVRLHIDSDAQERTIDYYSKNVKAYKKQNKKFQKILKKSGHI